MNAEAATNAQNEGTTLSPSTPAVHSTCSDNATEKVRHDRDHSLARRLRASGVWALIGRVSSVFLLLTLHAWLAQRMHQVDYGRYVLLESSVLILSLCVLGGLPIVGLRLLRVRLVKHDREGALSVVQACLVMIAICSLLTAIGAWGFAWKTQNYVLNGILWQALPWVLGWAICVAILRLISELSRGYERFWFAYSIGGQSGGFGVNAVLVLASIIVSLSVGLTLPIVLGMQIAVQVVFVLWGGIFLFRIACADGLRSSSEGFRSAFQELLHRAWPLLIMQLVTFGLPEVDTMLVGSFMTPQDAALYGAARRLIIVVGVPLLLMNQAIQPFVTEIHTSKNPQQLSTLIRGTATIVAIPSMLIVLLFILIPDVILATLFGDKFAAAAPALRILSLGRAVFVLTGSCSLVLTMTGHEHSAMIRAVVVAACYLVAAPLLISRYGIVGAATSAAILQAAANIVTTLLVYKHEKIWTTATFSPSTLRHCFRLFFPSHQKAARKAGCT